MAIKDMKLSGKVRTGNGAGVTGADVSILPTAAGLDGTAHATTDTTDSDGTWNFTIEGSSIPLTNAWDVLIESGDSKRYLPWSDEIALKGVDTSYLKIRGIGDTDVAPLYFIADRGETVGDIWRIQATDETGSGGTLTIGNNKVSVNAIEDYITITNGASPAASLTTILGQLTVGVNDTGADVKFFGATSGSYWLWDESADGVVQIGTLTVGVDDAGHDVKFFGNTASAYMLWDTSADDLVLAGAAGIDLAGNIDVDGTANLDAVDIDGAVQIDATFTSGVDGQGYDTKFFGDTSGAYILWDTSADKLLTAGGAVVDIVKDKLLIGGTAVTTTAAELNLLDTASANSVVNSKAVIYGSSGELAGTLSTAAQGNVTSLGTLTSVVVANAGNIGSASDTDAIAISSGGVVTMNQIPVFSAGINVSSGTIAGTLSGATQNNITTMTGLVTTGALASGTIASGFGTISTGNTITTTALISGGSLDIDHVLIDGTTIGHTDDTDLITLADGIATVAGEISVTTLDIGGTNVSATAVEINYLDITTLGTSEASKAVTVDSNGDLLVPDSDKYKFGAGSDMQLYHDGTDSYMTNATGALKIATETSGIAVTIGHTTSETTVADNLSVTGTVFINESANTFMDNGPGLTINQGAADDEIISLKSSDIAHGMTSAANTETDTYGAFGKVDGNATAGGLQITGYSESIVGLALQGRATTANTTDGTGARGAVEVEAKLRSGTTTTGYGNSDNALVVRNNETAEFIVKGDGELYSNQSATVATFDEYDDAQLARALDLTHGVGVIDSKFDEFIEYNREKLADLKLIGRDEDGSPNKFVNITRMQRLHNGAIWQGYERQMELQERVEELETKLLALEGAK